ncbi:MAG: heme-binding protein [Betaproteobacteria bacterium]|nr:heme-binding protein [Betaproteobacteria bacterium]
MIRIMLAALLALATVTGHAQQRPDYGQSINLENAKKAVAAAQAEARKNSWNVAIAVLDIAGNLVTYERMDQTQTASVQVAIDKGVSAAIYRRSTKVFEDLVGKGAVRLMNLRNASMVEGGLPIFVDGKVVGGIGVSGVNSDQDGVVAKAGADAIK